MANKFDTLSWLPLYLLAGIWVVSLLYYRDYEKIAKYLLIGTVIILMLLWQKYFMDKSFEYENKR